MDMDIPANNPICSATQVAGDGSGTGRQVWGQEGEVSLIQGIGKERDEGREAWVRCRLGLTLTHPGGVGTSPGWD